MKVDEAIKDWLDNPQNAVKRLIDTYGEPQDVCNTMVIWYDCKPWKRTIITKEETPHNFPHPHTDYVEQFIDYAVPIDMIDNVVRFDGSVVIDRTRGEMSARCGGTSMNFVAINLAHELIIGKKTLEGARQSYNELYQAYQDGKKPEYTQKFMFESDGSDTNDPGVELQEKK